MLILLATIFIARFLVPKRALAPSVLKAVPAYSNICSNLPQNLKGYGLFIT